MVGVYKASGGAVGFATWPAVYEGLESGLIPKEKLGSRPKSPLPFDISTEAKATGCIKTAAVRGERGWGRSQIEIERRNY